MHVFAVSAGMVGVCRPRNPTPRDVQQDALCGLPAVLVVWPQRSHGRARGCPRRSGIALQVDRRRLEHQPLAGLVVDRQVDMAARAGGAGATDAAQPHQNASGTTSYL